MKKLLTLLLVLLPFATQADFDTKDTIYVDLLTSKNLQEVKLGAKALHHSLPENIQLWDLAAFTLWSMNQNGDKEHDEFDDTISWLAKAIGESQNARYRTLLTEQNSNEASRKVKKYFKSAIKALNKDDVPQFQPQEFELASIKVLPNTVTPTLANFEMIAQGATLDTVITTLGKPDGVGQYLRSYRRPFIGRQTFHNLRLSYINLGSMELKYEKTEWVVDLISIQTSLDISGVADQYRDLLSRLVSNDVTQIRAAAREAIKLPLQDEQSLDHIAQYIWNAQNTQDKQFADSLAWLCKVLSNSGNGRYKEMLQTLSQKPLHSKITRYAAKSAKSLTSTEPFFTPAIQVKGADSSKTDNL
ncbi:MULTISPECIES: hypothetical protein [Shewanella]|uniref:hypothetical protein n=1 Tax=Shewanella TaxID=22 RepID=UPI001C7DC5BC|nr:MULTISPECIES: hypothetical protein [Shewanella]